MKNRPPALREQFASHAEGLCISSITLAELHFGAEKSARRRHNLEVIAAFTAQLDVLDFCANAAAHHGRIRAEMQRAGTLAGPYDMLIGAHARSEGLIVVTNNLREFERMSGVRAENWV